MASERFQDTFPLHWNVWENNFQEVDRILKAKEADIETVDPRGRTPLHLAVTLGLLESTRVLLRHGANANAENAKYWSVVQEAVGTGDPELLQLVLQHRDYQRLSTRTEGVPALLQKLKEAPDFYVEMKWEFTSWVPVVSRFCPNDTYKVYKRGSKVRIDTTLLGFDNMNWQRGSRSFVFKGDADSAVTMEIDHDAQQVWSESLRISREPPPLEFLAPTEDQVAARLTTPIATTYIDTDKIAFERSKSGIWGWRSDKVEVVNGQNCKVFSASNVELVTKQRVEHMTDADKQQSKKSGASRNPLHSFLGMAEKEQHKAASAVGAAVAENGELLNTTYNPSHITREEYFDSEVSLNDRDIGRPIEQTTKVQKFKAQLWLCEDYPLSLQEQVIPIIDLMAVSNAHFRKLRDFITLQLPAGFPVKIEIPLFHVLNARITFGNIFALDRQVTGVTSLSEPDRVTCVLDDAIFDAPQNYSVIGSMGGEHVSRLRDEDDQILQFAIQQSLLEAGSENEQVTVWEALNRDGAGGSRPAPGGQQNGGFSTARLLRSDEERQLQIALEASLMSSSQHSLPSPTQSERRDQSQEHTPSVSDNTDNTDTVSDNSGIVNSTEHVVAAGENVVGDNRATSNTCGVSPAHALHRSRPLPAQPRGFVDADLQMALELSRMSAAEEEGRRREEEERQRREEAELAQILALSLNEK